MIVLFLALVSLPASAALLLQPKREWLRLAALCSSVPTAGSLAEWADGVARDSEVAHWTRGYYQYFLTRELRVGSAKVTLGSDGALFMREDLLICTGSALSPQRLESRNQAGDEVPGSAASIMEYEQQIRAAGIHLVVVPVPLAPVLYPERIWSGYPAAAGPGWNEDYLLWKKRLLDAGVDVVDVSEVLWRAKTDLESPWVPHNTHWSPHGAAVAAHAIAAHVRPWLGGVAPVRYTSRTVHCRVASDVVHMLDLPRADLFPDYPCRARLVFQNDRLAAGDDDAPVLLLGDSFTAEYSEAASDQVIGADLGRQLMLELSTPVHVVTEYGLDPLNARVKLWGYVPALRQKRVIVWEFAARHLMHPGTWAPIPFPLPPAPARGVRLEATQGTS